MASVASEATEALEADAADARRRCMDELRAALTQVQFGVARPK